MTRFSGCRRLSARWTLLALLATAAFPAAASAGGVYFVKEGDTLYRIARVFGVDVDRLSRVNGIAGSDIKPGDRIRIPDPVAASASRREASRVSAPPAPPAPAAPAAPAAEAATPTPVPLATLGPPPTPFPEGRSEVDRLLCREERVYHRVVKGDTLAAIGRLYDVPLDDLFSLNRLSRRSRLSIGQQVLVRRSGPRTHVVRRGETLKSIAASSGVSVAEIRRFNALGGDRIATGTSLLLESCDRYALAATSAPAFPPAAESGRVGRLVDFAKDMLDTPYRFGGTSLRGIDCSAYVQRVFGLLELNLPRTAREQFAVGARVDRDQLDVGDLVFFQTYASYASHVGIYLGNDRFIHASSFSRKVTIDSLDRAYYRKRFLGARRVLPAADEQVASAPR